MTMEERIKGCDYCGIKNECNDPIENTKLLLDYTKIGQIVDNNIEIMAKLYPDTKTIDLVYGVLGNEGCTLIKVSYCPMCGRKL